MTNVQSHNSEAIGIDILFSSEKIYTKCCSIKNIKTALSGVTWDDFNDNPTAVCQALSVRLSEECKDVLYEGLNCDANSSANDKFNVSYVESNSTENIEVNMVK